MAEKAVDLFLDVLDVALRSRTRRRSRGRAGSAATAPARARSAARTCRRSSAPDRSRRAARACRPARRQRHRRRARRLADAALAAEEQDASCRGGPASVSVRCHPWISSKAGCRAAIDPSPCADARGGTVRAGRDRRRACRASPGSAIRRSPCSRGAGTGRSVPPPAAAAHVRIDRKRRRGRSRECCRARLTERIVTGDLGLSTYSASS